MDFKDRDRTELRSTEDEAHNQKKKITICKKHESQDYRVILRDFYGTNVYVNI